MKQSLNESKSLAVLLGIVVVLLLGAFYYYFIYPKVETKKQTEQAISQLQTDITTLEQHVAVLSAEDTGGAGDFELRKKLPAQRQLDNLLRSIHEVEVMSDSQILKMTFNNYDEAVAQAENFKSKEETATATEQTETSTTKEVAEGEKPVTPINIETLPTELKLMSLELEMQVLDEEHLMLFLQELEAIERIVRIDGVTINQVPGEVELTQDDPDKQIPVTVQLTTFYAEDVAD
ncbi:hypothetical protein [Sporosarcina sp. YIM B06819]|uniref:hypothetical protein n=1 Tax=Sporosarcina sp. YIM B06819 TaxID=3081769 RepID=UPI00298D58EB|nr:hypothetical protein [Sporosarcina sp. YIM B06819]